MSGNWRLSSTVTTNSGTNDTTANATNTTEDKETSEEQVSIEAYTTNFISSSASTDDR
jgi:hypothetical protein